MPLYELSYLLKDKEREAMLSLLKLRTKWAKSYVTVLNRGSKRSFYVSSHKIR